MTLACWNLVTSVAFDSVCFLAPGTKFECFATSFDDFLSSFPAKADEDGLLVDILDYAADVLATPFFSGTT